MAIDTSWQQHVSTDAAVHIEKWLTDQKYAQYRDDVLEMIEAKAWTDLEDAFFKVVEFGTGGRRGTTGVGSNRINRVTIGESVQALCEYAHTIDPDAKRKGVVIAGDTRVTTPELIRYSAEVAAAAGYTTYVFDGFRATPELSFAVRHLGCAIGIVISASHNPPEDNGFKAYGSDGAQLVSPHDKGVLAVAETIEKVNAIDYEKARESGLIVELSQIVDEAYLKAVVDQAVGTARDVTIVYSPLHGAGQTNVLPGLRAAGFEHISVVEEQMIPDGLFPTIENRKPNPEEKSANDRAVAQMMAENADIAITNDPDADRIGVIVRQGDAPVYLSGNQSAILATEYSLRKMHEAGALTSKHYIAKTIVTTDMLKAIADAYGVTTYGDMLIGYKYIGELILSKESTDEVFVIGAEESFGLLKGDYARDKDGATGALPLAEYAAELKEQGLTLYDRMLELYRQYGLYVERLDTIVCTGASGFEQMQTIMQDLRSNPPTMVGSESVTAVLDYASLTRTDIATGEQSPITCVKGNVIVLECGDVRRRITIRPSGTEPKLKFYVQWYADAPKDGDVAEVYDDIAQHIEGLSRSLEGVLLES